MKVSTIFLVGTLSCNTVLLAVLGIGLFRNAHTSRPGENSRAAFERRHLDATIAESWSWLHPEDLSEGMDKLKSAGFPPAVVRAILAVQIHNRFADRYRALDTERAAVPFWKGNSTNPQVQIALFNLAQQEQIALNELLGARPNEEALASLRYQFPDWSEGKLSKVSVISEKYDALRNELFVGTWGGVMRPNESGKLIALDNDLRAEISTVLTPQELENYDLRTSMTADKLRAQVELFEPTEEEFRSLYTIQRPFDDEYGFYGRPNDVDRNAWAQAQAALEKSIKSALGDERYADFRRANDRDYRLVSKLVERIGLPVGTANQVYAVSTDIQRQASALRKDVTIPAIVRLEKLAALQKEAETSIGSMLGPAGFDAYKKYGGSWLQRL